MPDLLCVWCATWTLHLEIRSKSIKSSEPNNSKYVLFLHNTIFAEVRACWGTIILSLNAASPRVLFRPPNHAFLRRRGNAALSAGTVSNEFSTAVLADSMAVRGERYLFSITVTPGFVTLYHGIIWSDGPFSLCDLALNSRMHCVFANATC